MRTTLDRQKNLLRALVAAAAFICWHGTSQAAPSCVPATEVRKSAEPIIDWYDNYIRPYRLPGGADAARLTKSEVEAFIEEIEPFHRRALLDQLVFESLVARVMTDYARAPDFKGIDTAAVEKLYNSGSGQKFDFSLLCISSRSLRTPDDAFAITLFGVVADDCQHVGLGLVFTDTLVNGSANGQCKPDQVYRKMIVVPISAGTNEITYICGKDVGGCTRR
jgi:hypothetical protein